MGSNKSQLHQSIIQGMLNDDEIRANIAQSILQKARSAERKARSRSADVDEEVDLLSGFFETDPGLEMPRIPPIPPMPTSINIGGNTGGSIVIGNGNIVCHSQSQSTQNGSQFQSQITISHESHRPRGILFVLGVAGGSIGLLVAIIELIMLFMHWRSM